MLQPKKTKFRKAFKGRIHGNAKGGTSLNFASYGLKAKEPERITARQSDAARRGEAADQGEGDCPSRRRLATGGLRTWPRPKISRPRPTTSSPNSLAN